MRVREHNQQFSTILVFFINGVLTKYSVTMKTYTLYKNMLCLNYYVEKLLF